MKLGSKPFTPLIPLMLASALLFACAQGPVSSDQPPKDSPPGSKDGITGSQQADWASIERLEQEAKTIAKAGGCAASGDCRAAPVGSRACGGPRYYISYCAKSTDSVALQNKLDQVANAERDYNRKYNIASTCEFRMPPTVEAVGGVCTAR